MLSSMEEKDNPKLETDDFQELLQNLQQRTNWDGRRLVKYGGVWCPDALLRPILSCQKNFKAKDSDVILSTMPKSGTTWLKALVFSIVNRNIDQSPLLTSNPHKLVTSFEYNLYWNEENPDLQHIPSPRILSTHQSFNLLPHSIRTESQCKIIYLCRNPLDQFISFRHFCLNNKLEKDPEPLTLQESFDLFCQGVHTFGPIWDHLLGYWNACLENPGKVLFLKYEDLKEGTSFHVRKIAEFIGLPFSEEEEKRGLVEQITRLCSFENLSNLEVNKNENNALSNESVVFKFSSFFRKGKVGDWTNYLTPEMAERFEKIMESKLAGSSLKFNT